MVSAAALASSQATAVIAVNNGASAGAYPTAAQMAANRPTVELGDGWRFSELDKASDQEKRIREKFTQFLERDGEMGTYAKRCVELAFSLKMTKYKDLAQVIALAAQGQCAGIMAAKMIAVDKMRRGFQSSFVLDPKHMMVFQVVETLIGFAYGQDRRTGTAQVEYLVPEYAQIQRKLIEELASVRLIDNKTFHCESKTLRRDVESVIKDPCAHIVRMNLTTKGGSAHSMLIFLQPRCEFYVNYEECNEDILAGRAIRAEEPGKYNNRDALLLGMFDILVGCHSGAEDPYRYVNFNVYRRQHLAPRSQPALPSLDDLEAAMQKLRLSDAAKKQTA